MDSPTLRRRLSRSLRSAGLGLVVLALVANACGDDDTSTGDAAGDEPAADVEVQVDLESVCPNPIVMQTGWFPEPEHGMVWQLAETGGTTDTDRGTYTAPAIADPRVDVEIRAGGPFLGNQSDTAALYQDPDILLGMVALDEAIAGAEDQPTIAVTTTFEKSPRILMWNPEEHDFAEMSDIGQSGAPVVYFEGSTYVDYLVGADLVEEDQLDGSFDGSPSRFVAEGDIVQQEFVTQAPYVYEHELEEWGRPVDYFLVADETGFANYESALAATPDTYENEADCLERLVPLIQQASIDYIEEPGPVNGAILQTLEELDGFFQLTPESVAYSAETMRDLGLVANGPDGAVGSFDEARVTEMIELLRPIYDDRGIDVPEDLAPADVVTNEFIDPDIGF
jgi:hypothetical protein